MCGEWFYRALDIEHGPVSFSELKELARSGFLAPDTPVRRGADVNWTTAGDQNDLFLPDCSDDELTLASEEKELGVYCICGQAIRFSPPEPGLVFPCPNCGRAYRVPSHSATMQSYHEASEVFCAFCTTNLKHR